MKKVGEVVKVNRSYYRKVPSVHSCQECVAWEDVGLCHLFPRCELKAITVYIPANYLLNWG